MNKFMHFYQLRNKEKWMDDEMDVLDVMRHMKIFLDSPSLLYEILLSPPSWIRYLSILPPGWTLPEFRYDCESLIH